MPKLPPKRDKPIDEDTVHISMKVKGRQTPFSKKFRASDKQAKDLVQRAKRDPNVTRLSVTVKDKHGRTIQSRKFK